MPTTARWKWAGGHDHHFGRPIPGNEKTVGTVVDELLKRGCRVVYESMYEVHVSGHACQEELKIMQAIVRPKFFIPVHGEQKHLRKHAMLAHQMGLEDDHIFIGDVGSAVELSEDGLKQLPNVPAGRVMVDGLGVGDVGSVVLRDRRHLGEDGLIVVVCTIDRESGQVVSGPDVVLPRVCVCAGKRRTHGRSAACTQRHFGKLPWRLPRLEHAENPHERRIVAAAV